MKLTKENLQEWKKELSHQMSKQYNIKDFDQTITDESWIETYLDETVQEVIDTEMHYSAQN